MSVLGRPAIMTKELAIQRGNAFVALEGRLPITADLHGDGLPYLHTVRRLFGTVEAYAACLDKPPPVWVAKKRSCNRCLTLFLPTHQHNHTCKSCKTLVEWKETGEWLNGSIITWRGI